MDQCPGLGGSVPVDLRDSVAQRRCLWQTKIMHQRFSGDITDEKLNNRRFYQKVEETPTHVSGAQSLQIASKRIPKKMDSTPSSTYVIGHLQPPETRTWHIFLHEPKSFCLGGTKLRMISNYTDQTDHTEL